MMRTNKCTLAAAALLGLALFTVSIAVGQTAVKETTTTTTTSLGTVSEFGADTIMIRSQDAPDPIRYSYTSTTTYVDEAGMPVSAQMVKSGIPVTIHYTKVGDRMVATKVIVRKAVVQPVPIQSAPMIQEKKTTTTTTTTDK